MDYIYSILILTGITMIGVMGTYMVTGLTGQFSFGQAAFMAVGGYVSAMLVLSFGHIYMGTIGVHGAYASMKTGYVDETWAREHHEEWYNDVKAGKSGHPQG